MPAEELMSWSIKQKRWYKRYRGRLYWIGPKTLKCEATKEASRKAANDWWAKKQTEIDEKLGEAKKHPAHVVTHYETAIENHRIFAKWHRRYGDNAQAEKSEGVIEWLEEALKSDAPPFPLPKWQEDPLWDQWQDEAAFVLWTERRRQIFREEQAETAVPRENTIRAHIDDYLDLLKTQAIAKGRLGSWASQKQWLGVFRSWVDPFAPIESITETLWERFSVYLAKRVGDGKISPTTMKDYQSAARAFIRNRWASRLIELPRNLNSRALTVPAPIKDPVLFTIEEIKQLLGGASERQKLYLLLALNCGMYPVDIAHLRQDEVDWASGRIKRKRTKTRDRSNNVPRVDYLLWRQTFDLLKKHRSSHPELVLINRNGSPLWVEREKNGKFDRNSNIKTAYFQLVAVKLKIAKEDRKPLISLRKTPATMLENSQYGRFSEHFLGEAPHTTASRHYAHKNGAEFDEAIKWLGSQLGIE